MRILAIDGATVTGWALIVDGKPLESGTQDFSKKRGEGNGILFLRFRKWLGGLMQECGGVDLLAYERSHSRSSAAAEIGIGLQTRVQELAEETGIESFPASAATLKKWATGRGNAKKPEMVKWARGILGREPEDDNEADALAVGLYAAAILDSEAS